MSSKKLVEIESSQHAKLARLAKSQGRSVVKQLWFILTEVLSGPREMLVDDAPHAGSLSEPDHKGVRHFITDGERPARVSLRRPVP